jgi:hypothetical protein
VGLGTVRRTMTRGLRSRDVDDETDIDELDRVDWIVVEFPGGKFNGEIAPASADHSHDDACGARP